MLEQDELLVEKTMLDTFAAVTTFKFFTLWSLVHSIVFGLMRAISAFGGVFKFFVFPMTFGHKSLHKTSRAISSLKARFTSVPMNSLVFYTQAWKPENPVREVF